MPGVAGSTPARILERERELASVDAACDDALAGRGVVIVVDAAAGLGKSTFLAAAAGRAVERGLRVLRARGDALVRDHPWGVATQLVGEVPQPRSIPGAMAHDPFPVIHGLYRATASLAEHTPLMVVVDDAHWADAQSLTFLHYLGGRLDELQVVIALSRRSGEPCPPAVADALDRLAALPRARCWALQPLSYASVAALVTDIAPGTAERCQEAIFSASGGNPFLTHQLVRSAESASRRLDDPATAEFLRSARPDAIRAAIRVRLSALGRAATSVAEAVALLGPSATTREVVALAALAPDDVACAVDALVQADLLEHPGPAGVAEPLRFLHPVVREVVYGAVGPARTARGHLRAAALLHRQGAPSGEVAEHLLRAEPSRERWAIDHLHAAATEARAQRAPDRAAALLRRALELCDEPKRSAELTMLLAATELALGRAEGYTRVGDAIAALPTLTDAVAAERIGEFALALYAHGRFREARTAFELALARAAQPDPLTEATLVVGLEMAGLLAADPSDRARERVRSVLRGLDDDRSLPTRVLAALAAGHLALGVDLAEAHGIGTHRERILKLLAAAEPADLPAALGPTVLEPAAIALWLCDELDEAQALLGPAIESATRDGELVTYSSLLPLRALVSLTRGDLQAAMADAADAIRLAGECAAPNALARGPAEHALVNAALERGDIDATREIDRDDHGPVDRPHSPIDGWHLHAVGRLLLAEGRAVESLDLLLLAGDRFRSAGGPGAYCSWRVDAAAAARAAGDGTLARELSDEELRWAAGFGSPSRESRALRSVARGADRAHALDHLRRAVAITERSPARLERAHALVEYGAALRRAGRRTDAREHLRAGLGEAQRCAAEPLARFAADELERAGARRIQPALHGFAALTPSEARVARLAARGHTNQQIAEMLFVHRKTVEVHLTNTYRKLGVRGRAELPAVVDP